ncbi:hypothetical protein KR018_000083, partial [Drosophila ironensis]
GNRANGNGKGNSSNATITTGVTMRSKLTAPLSTHTAGTRKAVHGGGGDGGSVDGAAGLAWKQTGRRLGSGGTPGTAATKLGSVSQRLVQPTIASSLRASNVRRMAIQLNCYAPGTLPTNLIASSRGRNSESVSPKPVKRRVMTAAAKQAARDRLWPVRPAGCSPRKAKLSVPQEEVKLVDDFEDLPEEEGTTIEEEVKQLPVLVLLETGVQTNEEEILDHELLLGSVKLVAPSPGLLQKIERERRDLKAKLDKQATRRFATYEQNEELHLDELKEFTERNAITKRVPKKPTPILYSAYENQYQNVFKSMDDFFSRDIPKSESVANIQERIKRKELELMSLFDDVDVNE